MIRSTAGLFIKNGQDLRDPERMKALWWSKHWGNLIAATAAWLIVAALAYVLVLCRNSGLLIPFSISLFGGMTGWFAVSFWREVFRDPLYWAQSEPERYTFVLGELMEARYSPGRKRSLDKYLLAGKFSWEKQTVPVFQWISPGLWKTLKWKLPRPAWIILDPNNPAVSSLAGVPSVG